MDFDLNPNPQLTCSCGRVFAQLNALSHHRHSCSRTKKRLSDALSAAKEAYAARKRRRIGLSEWTASGSESDLTWLASTSVAEPGLINIPHASEILKDKLFLPIESLEPVGSSSADDNETVWQNPLSSYAELRNNAKIPQILDMDHLDQRPIATRKANRAKRTPKRYQDILPESASALAPSAGRLAPHSILPPSEPHPMLASTILTPETSHESAILQNDVRENVSTPYNVFGLRRIYRRIHSQRDSPLLLHDPEDYMTMDDLWDGPTISNDTLRTNDLQPSAFYPYPNRNSFLLGDWYWNTGGQKSLRSLKSLIDIVGHPTFNPEDVSKTQWNKINQTLAGKDDNDSGEWEDEDAGWLKTDVTISVPFLARAIRPGPQNFVVKDFYYRSLTSVIKERVTNGTGHYKRFHFNPFEIYWRQNKAEEMRVYGELYTSPKFIAAHQDLQQSPPEPGCDLPRVIIALMLWSDATQLTSFGDAKLWPLYLFFGNDSKYLRCKPTCHMCSHVAYFVKVKSYNSGLSFLS